MNLGRGHRPENRKTMLFSPRIRLKSLAALSRRLSIALGAGIDVRTVWTREAERATGPLRRPVQAVSHAVHRGESLADALTDTQDFFPVLFREMVAVGEQTGHLETVLAQLADHYEGRLSMRRAFLAAITWPLAQLGITLAVVGFLIWIMGVIRDATGNREFDMLGLGLTGERGLQIYVTFLALLGVLVWLTLRAIHRGVLWVRPVQRFAMALPGLGPPLQTLALSRLAWSMHLTMSTGMDVRRALKLSLNSTQNSHFVDQIPAIDAAIVRGNSIHESFVAAGGYPADFLDTLAVGEESGEIVECMERLARQYQEQARLALAALTTIAGWAVWAVVGTFIVVLIFRVFSFYLAALHGAMQ